MRMIVMVAASLLATEASLAAPPSPAPIQVMVLGTYHMGNPGRDLHNIEADDVRASRRQAELARLTASLATFRPTRVMVERESDAPGLAVAEYRGFTPAQLHESRNETVQIGYRLARIAGLTDVQGIDEQPGPGERDYFPFDKVQAWADAHGRRPALDAMNADVGLKVDAVGAEQATRSVAELLMAWDDPKSFNSRIDFYYGLLPFGDPRDQPGAELNAGWYERNAKIFAKLMTVAQPGDRIVVVFGSGHNYWLRHFARETPGFASVDVMPYLRKAR